MTHDYLSLERHRPEAWMLPQAEHLFDTAVARGWDEEIGGLIFTFDPSAGDVLRDPPGAVTFGQYALA